jgi:hypothetical protein
MNIAAMLAMKVSTIILDLYIAECAVAIQADQ